MRLVNERTKISKLDAAPPFEALRLSGVLVSLSSIAGKDPRSCRQELCSTEGEPSPFLAPIQKGWHLLVRQGGSSLQSIG